MKKSWVKIFGLLIVLFVGSPANADATAQQISNLDIVAIELEGPLAIVWGDPKPKSGGGLATRYFLSNDQRFLI